MNCHDWLYPGLLQVFLFVSTLYLGTSSYNEGVRSTHPYKFTTLVCIEIHTTHGSSKMQFCWHCDEINKLWYLFIMEYWAKSKHLFLKPKLEKKKKMLSDSITFEPHIFVSSQHTVLFFAINMDSEWPF